MTQCEEATIAQPIERLMPMHCDCCEVSNQLDLLAVTMYELNSAGERVGRVRQLLSITLLVQDMLELYTCIVWSLG